MAQKKTSKASEKKSNIGASLAIGAGLVAAAAAGYLLFGPKGKENRVKIKGWTLKAKGDILEAIEKMDHVTSEKYQAVVDKVTKKYAKVKNITEDELSKFEKEARKHWKSIERDLAGKTQKTATKIAKKAGKLKGK